MPILEIWSEVKVTVTQGWYATLHHPNMHAHTKFGIPTSNNKRYASDTNIPKTMSEVKVKVTVPFQDAFTQQIWDSCLKE